MHMLRIAKLVKPRPKKSIMQDAQSDPLGMYTGTSTIDVVPEQDPDDL